MVAAVGWGRSVLRAECGGDECAGTGSMYDMYH
jgi:hypothetical protein